jgi:cyanophycin synthetase
MPVEPERPRASGARRLTGAGPLLDGPGAALDASGPGLDAAVEVWRRRAGPLLDALGWGGPPVVHRLSGGAALAVPAPPDALYAALALAEAAWAAVEGDAPAPDAQAAELAALAAAEARPDLVALERAAVARGVTFLRGDDHVSVGLGARGRVWPEDAPPAPDAVPWGELADVPVALVTGTNGKTTVVRMLGAVLHEAGHTAAVTTTDYVAVGGEVIERGDCSGPQSARRALRDPRTTAAALEIARGGLLRRGLPLPRAAAACVTNVAADHLGEYGVDTVEELADVKFAVHRALGAGGVLVTSGEDALGVARAAALAPGLAARGAAVGLTALTPDHPALAAHPGPAAALVGGRLARRDGPDDPWRAIVEVAAVPVTFGGRAAYNVRNALSVVLLARALGVPDAAVADGLAAFRGDAADNPGRGNLFPLPGGARALLDFAHNAAAMDALGALAGALPARRRLLLLSQPGDRRDAELTAFAAAAARLGAERYVVADLPDYLRGREPGETPAFLRRALLAAGIAEERVVDADDPAAGARLALDWAGPEDLLVLAVLSHRAAVADLIAARASDGAAR